MTDKILSAIKAEGIEHFSLLAEREEREELYFVKKKLDMLRSVKKNSYTVTIFKDKTGSDGEQLRGSASVLVFDGMKDEEIRKKLRDGYGACEYSLDRSYPLAKAEVFSPPARSHTPAHTLAQDAARAVFSADTHKSAYVCSCEIFVSHISTHIIGSQGTDVSFDKTRTWGECVVTCKEEEDVELYDCFELDGEDFSSLAPRISRLCKQARDRSYAKKSLRSIDADLIIEGDAVRDTLGIFLWKTDAKNVHSGYSDIKTGDRICAGSLSLDAVATAPYDREGVKMKDRTLILGGTVASLWGSTRYSSYIGAEATGEYSKIRAHGDCTPLAEMKKTPHLHVVSFSDFQADPLDGYIGGEIRLGYYFDGEKSVAVTGISVSANVSALSDSAEMSEETYESAAYSGPLAIKIRGASVSGCGL